MKLTKGNTKMGTQEPERLCRARERDAGEKEQSGARAVADKGRWGGHRGGFPERRAVHRESEAGVGVSGAATGPSLSQDNCRSTDNEMTECADEGICECGPQMSDKQGRKVAPES